MAKAPIPGQTKTRLISTIGAHAAAILQERLTERTVATARAAAVGPVTLWCAPDRGHSSFRELVTHHAVTLKRQPVGDLGTRMLAAMAASGRPTIVIGTDCPAFTPEHLRAAAHALRDADVVLIPAEDGGYVLIGLKWWDARLFADVAWGTDQVMTATRERLAALNWRWLELPCAWDVDRPADFRRLAASGLIADLEAGLDSR